MKTQIAVKYTEYVSIYIKFKNGQQTISTAHIDLRT